MCYRLFGILDLVRTYIYLIYVTLKHNIRSDDITTLKQQLKDTAVVLKLWHIKHLHFGYYNHMLIIIINYNIRLTQGTLYMNMLDRPSQLMKT